MHNCPADHPKTPSSLASLKSRLVLPFCYRLTQVVLDNTHTHARTHARTHAHIHARTHTHIRLTALCPGLRGWAGTRKAKPIWILLKQETVSGGGISWAICKSAPRSRQITMPAPHRSVFLQAGCPSCRQPTNSVKTLDKRPLNGCSVVVVVTEGLID